ncbi:MAG TPA: helix-turn-helix domain-containing protein [Gaiellaceae bacterium]|nr:helix-turn-helix domain-containing protein [Gaiellaceae bacterium]
MFEIGSSLRAARERQGLDYGEVELATKIRAKYLRALEEEDFDAIPGEAYARGFLRTYADYLGLDGDVYAEEYASRFPASWREELPRRRDGRRVRPGERAVAGRAVVLVLVAIVAVTALVFAAWRYGGSSSGAPSTATRERRAAGPARQLVLRGVGRGTYVEVRRAGPSGALVLQGTVSRGEVDRLAGSRFYLLVRRSAALRVTIGGRPVSLPAARDLRVLVTPLRITRLPG